MKTDRISRISIASLFGFIISMVGWGMLICTSSLAIAQSIPEGGLDDGGYVRAFLQFQGITGTTPGTFSFSGGGQTMSVFVPYIGYQKDIFAYIDLGKIYFGQQVPCSLDVPTVTSGDVAGGIRAFEDYATILPDGEIFVDVTKDTTQHHFPGVVVPRVGIDKGSGYYYDLGITGTAPVLASGQQPVYTFKVRNYGPDTAQHVYVNFSITAGHINFVSAAPSQGTFSFTPNKLWDVGSLASGSTATITFTCSNAFVGDHIVVYGAVSDTQNAFGTLLEHDCNSDNDKCIVTRDVTMASESVSITSARMINDHQLQVALRTAGYTGTRQVSISANINGIPVLTPDNDLPPGANSVIIDLAQQQVPRFTSNQRFTLTAHLSAIDGQDHKASKDMVILLPVVTISGVEDDNTLTLWEKDIIGGASDTAIRTSDSALLGEGYRIPLQQDGSGSSYFTIVTLSYSASNALAKDITAGVGPFRDLVSVIQQHTWADKVNVLAYSFGGITARACVAANILTSNGENVVHSVITLGTPHAGTPWAKWALPDGRPAPLMRALWPHYRRYPWQTYDYYPPNAGLAKANPQLAWLSGMLGSTVSFPTNIPLYLFYSNSFTNEALRTQRLPGSLFSITEVATPPLLFFGQNAPGDMFITAESQQGILVNANNSLDWKYIDAFQAGIDAGTIIPVLCPGENHSTFESSAAVATKIMTYFLQDIL